MSDHWLIVDCNYLAHRARYAMGGLSYNASPTGTIFGVLRDFVNLQSQFHTDKLAFCFDSKKSLRRELYKGYKAKRYVENMSEEDLQFEIGFRNQIVKLRKEYLPAIGYKNIFWQIGYESDDVMAELASRFRIAGNPDKATLVTADHDLYQCISPEVDFFNPRDKVVLTHAQFTVKFGILPHQWAWVKACAGCPSDSVDGIHGVGEATALKYLRNELKESTKTYQAIRSKVGEAIIKRNLPLVSLPFAGTKVKPFQQDETNFKAYRRICEQLGFASMLKDFNPFPCAKRGKKC